MTLNIISFRGCNFFLPRFFSLENLAAYSDLHRSKCCHAYLLLWNFRELYILNSEPNLQSDIGTLEYTLTSNKNNFVPLMSQDQIQMQTK